MVVLLWLVRIYKYLIIAWVLLTWIPGLAGSPFHYYLGLPVVPLLKVFGFLQIGFIGLQAIIPVILLQFAESWLEQRIDAARSTPHPPASDSDSPPDAERDERG